jgi:hypothetical protein
MADVRDGEPLPHLSPVAGGGESEGLRELVGLSPFHGEPFNRKWAIVFKQIVSLE